MIKTVLLLFVGLAAAGSDADLQSIKRTLAPFASLKGGFEESKKIKIIKKPLVSSGSFTLLRDKGVLWRTDKPMASLLRVSREDIAQIKDGKAAVLMAIKDQPALGLIGKVMFAVFSADVDELGRHFEFVKTSAPDASGRWSAVLRPRDALVRKGVARIELTGGRFVESVVLDEADGDVSVIRFTSVSEAAPSQEEAKLFE